MSVPSIDIKEAKKRIETGAVLVDVREKDEYDSEHIPGSILLPLSEFAERYGELPKDKALIMQCRSGARSAKTTAYLIEHGYSDVNNMEGGILAWVEAGFDTEESD